MIDLSSFCFSRSHQTDHRKCDRLGYLRYWLDDHGYVRAGISIELGTGTLYHNTQGEILESVLADPDQKFPSAEVIRAAVVKHNQIYENEMSVKVEEVLRLGLDEKVDRAGWHKVISRQSTLSEAMVRTWLKCRLPHFLANYELIAVEGEEKSEIAPGIFFMQRKDSVWRCRKNGTMHPLEFKTSGINSLEFVAAWHFDLQQVTHLLNFRNKYGEDPASVFLEITYKGRKYDGEQVGPLVSGYKMKQWKSTDLGYDDTLSDIAYDWDYKRCRTKGWEKFWIADEDFGDPTKSSAEVWTNEILDYETLAFHCLDTEIPYSAKKVERWLDQARREMSEVRDNLVVLQTLDDPVEKEKFIDVAFPCRDSKDNCAPYFGKKLCAFTGVCHGDLEVAEICEAQEFSPRQPHHPEEFSGKETE